LAIFVGPPSNSIIWLSVNTLFFFIKLSYQKYNAISNSLHIYLIWLNMVVQHKLFTLRIIMDDLQELHNEQLQDQERLEIALDKAEDGDMLTLAELDLIRFHCGLPNKRRVNPLLTAIVDDFSNIFGGKQ